MKHILYVLISILLCNCGAIPRYKKGERLKVTHIEQIEGYYQAYANDSIKRQYNALHHHLNWRKKDRDSTEFTSVKIEALSNKRLKVDFLLADTIIKSNIIKYRLRHNGFVKLRNNNMRISGIPILFGEYEIRKFQLGLDPQNNLVLHGIDDQAGGLLIIISGGFALEVNRVFERI